MVRHLSVDRRTLRRAQLILVASIAVAVVVLSLALVMNSLLVVETNTPGKTADRVDNTQTFDHEARRGTQSLILRLNHFERNWTGSTLASNVSNNVSVYSQILAESQVRSQSVFVNVTYHNHTSDYGYRLVQVEDGVVKEPDSTSDGDWDVTDEDRAVGWFTMNVNVTRTDLANDPVIVEATNETGDSVTISVNKTSERMVTVESNPDFGSSTTVRCDAPRGRILLDFVEGSTLSEGCNFTGIGALEQPMEVEFEDGTNVQAQYEVVVDDLDRTDLGYEWCHATRQPRNEGCVAPAVWNATLSTTFQSERVTYRNEYNVSVYNP